MNEELIKELEDPRTLMVVRLPQSIARIAKICGLFKEREAVVKAMPAGCQWMVIKKPETDK